eukprot:UN14652
MRVLCWDSVLLDRKPEVTCGIQIIVDLNINNSPSHSQWLLKIV